MVREQAGRGIRGQHLLDPAVSRQQTLAAPVPLGEQLAVGEDQVILPRRRQVEIEAQLGPAGLAVAGQGDLVHRIKGRACAIQVVLFVGRAIHLGEFPPGQDILHPDRDQAPVLLWHLHPLGLTAAASELADPIVRPALLFDAVVHPCAAGTGQGRVRVQPEQYRVGRSFSPREVGHAAWTGQCLADRALGGGLGAREPGGVRAPGAMGGHEALVAGPEPGKAIERPPGQALIPHEPVVARVGLAGGQGREPEIEVPIELGVGKLVDARRQQQCALVAPGQRRPVADTGDSGQQSTPGPVGGGIRPLDIQGAVAAECAEEDADAMGDLVEAHRRLWVAPLTRAGDQPVPELSDLLFHRLGISPDSPVADAGRSLGRASSARPSPWPGRRCRSGRNWHGSS